MALKRRVDPEDCSVPPCFEKNSQFSLCLLIILKDLRNLLNFQLNSSVMC